MICCYKNSCYCLAGTWLDEPPWNKSNTRAAPSMMARLLDERECCGNDGNESKAYEPASSLHIGWDRESPAQQDKSSSEDEPVLHSHSRRECSDQHPDDNSKFAKPIKPSSKRRLILDECIPVKNLEKDLWRSSTYLRMQQHP
jgi:hypothetical protein